ncbi:MAG: hypothetical protein Q9182_003916 [Xanthomendoza sp. 2 TL-2023]
MLLPPSLCCLPLSQLLYTYCLGLTLASRAVALNLRPPTVSRPVFPRHAPPEPWNQHVCINHPHRSNVRLTFTFGTPLPTASIEHAIQASKDSARYLIDMTHDDVNPQIPSPQYWMADENYVRVTAIRFKRRFSLQPQSFTLAQALEAVALIEMCGVDRGHPREMWAYVFVEGNQIGYITMEDDDLNNEQRNRTNGSTVY